MQKKIPYKSLVIVTTVLGIFISLQLKSINLENEGMTTIKKGEQLKQELKALKNEEKQLQEQIKYTEEKIESYKNNGEDPLVNNIKSEIKRYEELAGFTDIKGEGIKVTIESTSDKNEVTSDSINYNYDLLLSMINKLNSAQAKAISVNGQRIIYDSYLHLNGDELYLKDIAIKQPFIIEAIGNKETLSSALQIKYGIVWEMENYYNIKVTIEKNENMTVKAANFIKNIEDKDSVENIKQ